MGEQRTYYLFTNQPTRESILIDGPEPRHPQTQKHGSFFNKLYKSKAARVATVAAFAVSSGISLGDYLSHRFANEFADTVANNLISKERSSIHNIADSASVEFLNKLLQVTCEFEKHHHGIDAILKANQINCDASTPYSGQL